MAPGEQKFWAAMAAARRYFCGSRWDVAEAQYWYGVWNHTGQGDWRYTLPARSRFRPGPMATGPGEVARGMIEFIEGCV